MECVFLNIKPLAFCNALIYCSRSVFVTVSREKFIFLESFELVRCSSLPHSTVGVIDKAISVTRAAPFHPS